MASQPATPVESATDTPPPLTDWQHWLRGTAEDDHHVRTQPWYAVIWLTGVDYFSTLGYQPGIALLAAGAISPIATAVLILVTIFGALPIYSQVAGRSYVGQGSIAMLESLLPGWWGRVLVLVLLGFAATDFVITMTLSAADAATHAVENPFLHHILHNARMSVTLGLLALLALVFLGGFKEAIRLATIVCLPYLALNVVVLIRASLVVIAHPGLLGNWQRALSAHGDWTHLALAGMLLFPRLALGLSGFETGVSVMPLIRGSKEDDAAEVPVVRIENTRKLLITAALIMSVLLMASSFLSALLITPKEYQEGGAASGRVIAFMAHQYLGNVFGSIYDFSTILILWFAGASAMAGLLHLVPRYLPRVGLAPQWVAYGRPLVLLLFVINVIITVAFKANVDAQGGAYATGVLVLISSAAIASAVSLAKEHLVWKSLYCWLVVLVFLYTTVANIIERTDGIKIAACFIVFILLVSAISRYVRANELRVEGHRFCDDESKRLWDELLSKKVNLLPVDSLEDDDRARCTQQVKGFYRITGSFVFVKVDLLDNRSEFLSPIEVTVKQDNGDYFIYASQAVARANAIAYLSELIHPLAIFLSLTRQNPMKQSFRYMLLGEGETGLMVYSILQHYWESMPTNNDRPRLFLMSE